MAKHEQEQVKSGCREACWLTWVAGVLFVLVLLTAFLVGYLAGSGGGNGGSTGGAGTQTFSGAPLEGNANAPVTIIEYSDFQCPYCGRFFSDAYPQIKQQYIATGKVKLVFKDFPLTSLHPMAEKAAEAGQCALAQGNDKFWALHDKIFANQAQLSVDNLKLWASQVSGIDAAKFNSCLDSGGMAAIVQQQEQEGQQAGVSGTPSFTINGKLVVGAQPFSAFQTAIDAALAAGK